MAVKQGLRCVQLKNSVCCCYWSINSAQLNSFNSYNFFLFFTAVQRLWTAFAAVLIDSQRTVEQLKIIQCFAQFTVEKQFKCILFWASNQFCFWLLWNRICGCLTSKKILAILYPFQRLCATVKQRSPLLLIKAQCTVEKQSKNC